MEADDNTFVMGTGERSRSFELVIPNAQQPSMVQVMFGEQAWMLWGPDQHGFYLQDIPPHGQPRELWLDVSKLSILMELHERLLQWVEAARYTGHGQERERAAS